MFRIFVNSSNFIVTKINIYVYILLFYTIFHINNHMKNISSNNSYLYLFLICLFLNILTKISLIILIGIL